MNTTTNLVMLVKREIWENRSLWIAPLVVSGVILFAAAFGGIHVGHGDEFFIGWGQTNVPSPEEFDVGAERRAKIYAITISGFAVVQLFTMAIVLFFYLLDSLLSERKDRSILFWKSLPISDAQVVLSKLITALVLTPVFVLLVSAFTQLAFGPIWSLRGDDSLPGALLMPWDATIWGEVQLGLAAFVPAILVWMLPIAAYLLLVSVWVRRNAFLWAVLPPAALLLVEGMLLDTNWFRAFLGRRFNGWFDVMDFHSDPHGGTLGDFVSHVGRVFTSYEAWLGVLVAVGFLVAVIRIRRYRDDS